MFKKLMQDAGIFKKDEVLSTPSQTAVAVQPLSFSIPTAGPGQSTTDYGAYLDSVMEKGNLPGMDFLEFHKTLKTYDTKPFPEAQKYEFAFTSFEASGVSPQDLVKTSQHYEELLNIEEQDFRKQEAESTQTKVIAKQQEVERINRENEELNQRLQANTATTQKLAEEIYLATNSIAAEKQAFEFQLSNRRALIADRVAKIKQYLNGVTSIIKG